MRARIYLAGVTGDKDRNGKTVSGSKKAKVVDIISGLSITPPQKDVLYYAAGCLKSTIDETPWRKH